MQTILKIDLNKREKNEYMVPDDLESAYIGGASLGARILYDVITPELNPLSPEAPLLFLNGPLTGTAGPAVGRFVICGKSPATGLWAESNCGGFWGPELRKAGYMGLWITGKADKPVYLWIENDQVEICDAGHLWGMTTYQAQEKIIDEVSGKAKVAVIGPAGENSIPFAVVLTDHGRVAGRTGMGAVMGAKNLKAIAVRGTGNIHTVTKDYPKLRTKINRNLRDDNVSNTTRELGTASVADYADYLGEMPKKYFQVGTFSGVTNVSGSTMAETILTKVSACHACVIACGRVVKLPGEKNKRKGPEYETIVGFGPNLLIDDLSFITRMGELCDQLGMDTISLSNTIGLAFTLYESGVISDDDTGGIHLQWGDTVVVEELIKMTAKQEGFGSLLAEGSYSLGRRFGDEETAVQVNGLEVAYHDPRGASGMALSYATSPRGACHNQSDYFLPDIFGFIEETLGMEYFGRHTGVEKSRNVIIHQNWRTVFNALVMCIFANIPPESLPELINAAIGTDFTLETIMLAGERGWNIKRVINNRLGLNRANDQLPRLLKEPYSDGGSEGYILPFEEMLNAYYDDRGWDTETGYPIRSKLAELGLEWVDLP